MFHVAVLSRWHPHETRYTPELLAAPDCQVDCVWDENPERGRAWAQEIQVPFVGELQQIWENPQIDGVVITAPTVMHKEIIIAAARAGKHVFVEKSLALSYADALEIKKAIEENHVTFTIAYIRCTTGPFMFAKKILDSGLLGTVTTVRVRNGHNQALNGILPLYWFDPAQTGGGAMTDLGCHQMYLLDWLLGEPSELCSTFGNYTGHVVEDSGVCTALYNQGKTVAIMDSSFTTFFSPYTFELYGTEGTVLVRIDQPGVEVHLPKEKKPWFVETLPQEAVTVREYGDRRCYQVSSAALPDDPSPLRSWVDACTKGVPVKFGIDSAVRLTHVIEGANEAYQTGKVYRF